MYHVPNWVKIVVRCYAWRALFAILVVPKNVKQVRKLEKHAQGMKIQIITYSAIGNACESNALCDNTACVGFFSKNENQACNSNYECASGLTCKGAKCFKPGNNWYLILQW